MKFINKLFMAVLRRKFKNSLLSRWFSGFFGFLIVLGRWEYRVLCGRRFVRGGFDLWLIMLGRRVERFFLCWLAVSRRLMAGLFAAVKKTVKNLQPRPRWVFLRSAAVFAGLAALIILPVKFYGHWQFLASLKKQIALSAQAAFSEAWSAKQAIEQKDFAGADRHFSQASASFLAANEELKKVNSLLLSLASLVPNEQARLASEAEAILQAGKLGSEIAADLTKALEALFGGQASGDLVDSLADFNQYADSAKHKTAALNKVLQSVDSRALPENYQPDFLYLKDRVQFLSVSLTELSNMVAKLRIFLGEAYDKRYLLIFQNNTEVRATGGFMGSFAVVDFRRGKIKNLVAPGGGTYDTEGGLLRAVAAPPPLQLLRARWQMWDANWWPDWPMSARKIMWFYEQSGGSTVDGVISLTPEVVIRLLRAVGPVKLDGDFATVITADNFMDTVQSFAEQKYGPTNQPKQIIGVLIDGIMAKIASEHNQELWLKIVGIIEQSLNEKHLLLYFSEQALQTTAANLGWDGRLKEINGDYLSVVNTNIGGAKSDKKIRQTIELTTNILSDGSLINHLKIIRDHQAIRGEEFSGVRNVDWLRIYVPLGSKLLEAGGFKTPDASYFEQAEPSWEQDPDLANELSAKIHNASQTLIYREKDKTVFANWSMVDPGEAAVLTLTYKLPFKLEARTSDKNWLDKFRDVFARTSDTELYRHSLLAQKQAGAVNSEINYRFVWPSGYERVWQYPDSGAGDYWPQDTDKYWGFILKAKK